MKNNDLMLGTSRCARTALYVSVPLWLLTAACREIEESPIRAARSFTTAFDSVNAVQLAEPDTAPLADLSALSKSTSGQWVVADASSGVIRLYDPDGSLVRSVGRKGSGPGEFAALTGAVITSDGRICGAGLRSDALTCFSTTSDSVSVSRLPEADALLLMRGPRETLLVATRATSGRPQLTLLTPEGQQHSRFFVRDSIYDTRPYWSSIFGISAAAATDRVYAVTAVSYPIRVFNVDGDSIGAIGAPPHTWREAQVVESGRFAGPEARRAIADWLRNTSVVSSLHIIADSVLVIGQAEFRPNETDPPPVFFRTHPTTIDLYHVGGDPIAEGLHPPGRPMYADSLLYVLTATPPQPWTIVGYRPRRGR